MSLKFSVIVPIYNSAKYLSECIESVLTQTYQNYELILINDGSTDDSFEICREYKKQYANIELYTQENKGLSATRNFGISVSSGDYIVFLDSDDYIEKDALEKFNDMIKATSSDVVSYYSCNFSDEAEKKTFSSYLRDMDQTLLGAEFYKRALYQNGYRACAPYYVTSRSLIERHDLTFKEGIYHEDELWTPILLFYAQRVSNLKDCLYCCRTSNQSSITRDPSKQNKRAADRMCVALELSDFFRSYPNKVYDSFRDSISAQYMYAVYDGDMANKNVKIDRFFPLRHARTTKYILKSLLFAMSPRLACRLRKLK